MEYCAPCFHDNRHASIITLLQHPLKFASPRPCASCNAIARARRVYHSRPFLSIHCPPVTPLAMLRITAERYSSCSFSALYPLSSFPPPRPPPLPLPRPHLGLAASGHDIGERHGCIGVDGSHRSHGLALELRGPEKGGEGGMRKNSGRQAGGREGDKVEGDAEGAAGLARMLRTEAQAVTVT